ncbi:transcription repressor NadR [Weissella halotolerans]|uniref:Transcriptional regulator n=1 Tax=Weissella halotolerans DSM 20190 TaxID=1123500 RepID=A0A0R2G1F0_9LACO|nr:transcription repressor NadR [Weissella halotolerans]KRN33270.1 transcriptional regulator [Weissella halotolerans DSM 20190]
MLGRERQLAVKRQIQAASQTISANQLAKTLHVSRQTIVGDVALLRASGEQIESTAQGYRYQTMRRHRRVIVVHHQADEVETELLSLIDAGVSVQDVQVDHPLYGLLKGELALYTRADVDAFLANYHQRQGQLLSTLTNGLHLHTVGFDHETQFKAAQKQLADLDILYQG